jgi:hypothetical protein
MGEERANDDAESVDHRSWWVAQPFAFFAKAGVVQPSQRRCRTQSYPSLMPWGLKRYQQTALLQFAISRPVA